jgi:hypothetical protein
LIKKAFDVTGAKPTEDSDKTLEGKQTLFTKSLCSLGDPLSDWFIKPLSLYMLIYEYT